MLNLLRKTSPRWLSNLLAATGPLVWAQQRLFGTVQGVFAVSLALYIYADRWGVTKPYSFDELLLWFSELESEAKTGIATSLITIVGFLIAFRTATANWKEQTLIKLRIDAAAEIENFFDDVARRVVDAQQYVRMTIDEVVRIQTRSLDPEGSSLLRVLADDAQAFRKARERLSIMSIEVHRLSSKHHALLMGIGGALEALDECATAVSEITEKMWIQVPVTKSNESGALLSFVEQIDVEQWKAFDELCESNYDFLSGLSGGLRGILISPLISVNLSLVSFMIDKRAKISDALNHVRPRAHKGT